MKGRKFLAILCYFLCIVAFGVCGYVSYLSYTNVISFKLGFLIFLPVLITTYWFSTFFSQLICKKGSDGKYHRLIGRIPYRIMNTIVNIITILLIGYWAYAYFILASSAN